MILPVCFEDDMCCLSLRRFGMFIEEQIGLDVLYVAHGMCYISDKELDKTYYYFQLFDQTFS